MVRPMPLRPADFELLELLVNGAVWMSLAAL